jgi:hypothetical protein
MDLTGNFRSDPTRVDVAMVRPWIVATEAVNWA